MIHTLKKLFLLSIFVFSLSGILQAQSFYLYKKTGFENSYLINQTRSLSFSDASLKINMLNGTATSIPLVELQKLTFTFSTGTPATEMSSSIKIYPNPATDYFNISMDNGSNATEMNIKIRSVDGKLIYNQTHKSYSVGNIRINVSNWNKGVYILYLHDGEKTEMKKVIKN